MCYLKTFFNNSKFVFRSRVINTKMVMNFPLEMDKVASRRTKVVSIRQSSTVLASKNPSNFSIFNV